MPTSRSSSSLGGLGLSEEPLKVFTHSSIDVKNIPIQLTDPIERLVSLAERLETVALSLMANVEKISLSFQSPINFFIYSVSISMLLYSSSVFVYGLYRINEKKKD
jgi:hypothetical protein